METAAASVIEVVADEAVVVEAIEAIEAASEHAGEEETEAEAVVVVAANLA